MATFEQYENLPGVKVSYEDGNLYTGNQVEAANTQSILIVGTAIDGPVGEPVSVNAIGGPKAAEKMFGGLLERVKVVENGVEKTVKVPHKGTLIRAMWEAIRSGNEDIRLIRISGEAAKTEIPAKAPNSDVTQKLADLLGNQLIPGNIAFSKPLALTNDLRLINVEKVEEFVGADTTGVPFKTFAGATGYQSVINTPGAETVYFAKDMFRPKNTLKITYKATKRNYSEVVHTEDGINQVESTKGLLTQDPSVPEYFSPEVTNWSDDPLHQVLVFVEDGLGEVTAIPSVNGSGDRLWRIGEGDVAVVNPLRDAITALEFQQGGIRFTSAYLAEVGIGTYPALTPDVTVTADYFYYTDQEVQASVDHLIPGAEKETILNSIPETGTLEVYYEVNGVATTLVPVTDYSLIYPTVAGQKVIVKIKPGVGPVGAKLFAHYSGSEVGTQDARLIVNAKFPGKLYGGIEDVKDITSVFGVKVAVEYESNENGTPDLDNRVIRFLKPADKKVTSSDIELRFRTKELRGVRTLREFANYVNGLVTNNVVQLEVPLAAGDVPLAGLAVTDGFVNLGEEYSVEEGIFKLKVDEEKAEYDAARFPWLGEDGFFNTTSLEDTKKLFETLGGHYQLVEGTIDEFELVEQGIYSQLENYAVDVIVLPEVHANTAIGAVDEDGALYVDDTKNFATQLAQHCAMVTAKTWETIGVLGVAPAPVAGLREIQAYLDLLTKGVSLNEAETYFYTSRGINPNFQNVHYMYNLATHELVFNDDGEPIDIGRYVNVVFGPEVGLGHERLGNYIANGASVYAALISQLTPEVSTTNKEVGVVGLRYNLSEAQHNQLAGGRYVAFESKMNLNGTRVVVVKDGVTAALPNSDYQRLSTVRITHATVQLIRKKADKFIGLPNGIAQRNSLATEIQAGLDRLKEVGVLQNFKFSIFSSAKDRVLGNAFITLELVPEYETRKIFTTVALRASL